MVFHETILPDGETTYLFSHAIFSQTTVVSESGGRFVVRDLAIQRENTIQTGDTELIDIIQGVFIDTGEGINGINSHVLIKSQVIIHPDEENNRSR